MERCTCQVNVREMRGRTGENGGRRGDEGGAKEKGRMKQRQSSERGKGWSIT